MIFWFSKSWRRKPSISRVRPANILPCRTSSASRSSSGSELTIDWMMMVGGPAMPTTVLVDPIGGDRLGEALAGQFAQPEQDRPVAAERPRQEFEHVVDDALPVGRLAQPPARCAPPRPSSRGSAMAGSMLGGRVSIMRDSRCATGGRSQRPVVGQREDIAFAAHRAQRISGSTGRPRSSSCSRMMRMSTRARRFGILAEADRLGDRGAAEQPVRAGEENLQHVELALGQVEDDAAAAGDHAAVEIGAEVAEGDDPPARSPAALLRRPASSGGGTRRSTLRTRASSSRSS